MKNNRDKIDFILDLMTLIFVVILIGFLFYNSVISKSSGSYICKSEGYDYYDNHFDKVHGVKYLKCCNEAIGEDTCGWVKKE